MQFAELDDDYTRRGDAFSPNVHDGGSGSPMLSMSMLRMPRQMGSDGESDDGDRDDDLDRGHLGLVLDRSTASSTVSMEPQERLEALQRANTELGRKLIEAEETLQNKLSEHEVELEEMQGRLEEVRSELSATKREEKELRSKEVGYFFDQRDE
jgi:hypothetical protein